MQTPNRLIILVKVDPVQEQDEHGIFIQEEWKRNPPTGVVTAVGEGVTFVKKGDRVFFDRYSAVMTPFGEDTRACLEESIFVKY